MLQWAAEEKTLLDIQKVIAAAWRMNSRQLCSYCKKLREMRPEMLAGCLGGSFLEMLDEISEMGNEERIKIWPQLMRDAERMLELIRDHQMTDERSWRKALYRLKAQCGRYFKTALGEAFILTLREKLGLDIPEQKLERYQKNQAERNSQEKSGRYQKNQVGINSQEIMPLDQREQEVTLSEQKELEIVASWLLEDEKRTKDTKKKKRLWEHLWDFIKLPDEAVIAGLACASICLLGVWLYGQAERNQSFWNVRRMRATAAAQQDIAGNSQGADGNAMLYSDSTAGMDASWAADSQTAENAVNGKAAEKTSSKAAGKTVVNNTENIAADSTSHEKRPKILAQYREMAKEYPGLFGWLQIPDTQVNLPVMRPLKEDDFYLHHDFTGAESTEGALFADPKSSRWPQDDNTVIYGHNMKNGHMFGILDMYTDADYFHAHKEIHFDTIYETGLYEAVAVVKTRILNENEQGFRYYQFFRYGSKEEFLQCLDFVKENQLFDSGGTLEYGDRILMLSTCEYSQENGRLVIVARKRSAYSEVQNVKVSE